MSIVAIIDYGLGNLASLAGAVEKLGHQPIITADPAKLVTASKLLLPGVGAFGDGMRNLVNNGLASKLSDIVFGSGKQLLGICLGAQLLCRDSEEFGQHQGLGWINARVLRLRPEGLRVPHVGWDELHQQRVSPLFDGISEKALFYYVHSYCIQSDDRKSVVGSCEYGGCFDAALSKDNIHAVQFHPEKSQADGLRLLRNFIEGM